MKLSEPENYFQASDQRALFESVSSFVIPKPELKDCFVCVGSERFKIVGCPNVIENSMYERNAYMFNVCLLFDLKSQQDEVAVVNEETSGRLSASREDLDAERERTSDVSAYEKIIRKIASAFRTLELESGTLTNPGEQSKVRQFLHCVMHDLNERGTCLLQLSSTNAVYLSLKPEFVSTDNVPVANDDVPVLVTPFSTMSHDMLLAHVIDVVTVPLSFGQARENAVMSEFKHDLTMKQILPCIDGIRHVKRIAEQLDMDQGIVKLALQNLLYYGVIKLVPIFKYSNTYMPTARVTRLLYDKDLQRQCAQQIFIPASLTPNTIPDDDVRQVFRIYCGMQIGVTVKDLCLRHMHVMERIVPHKLIEFGLVHVLIRPIQKYHCSLDQGTTNRQLNGRAPNQDWHTLSLMDGLHDEDKLLCASEKSPEYLASMLEIGNRIVTVRK